MRRLLAATVLAVAIACGRAPTVPIESIPGTYALATVNDSVLPSTIQATPSKREIIADQLALVTGGAFTEQRQERTTTSGTSTTATILDGGTWSLNGTSLTLRYTDGFRQSGDVDGNGALTFKGDKVTIVYRKQ